MPEPVVADRDQSRPEELANSLSHGLGLLAALIGTPLSDHPRRPAW